MVRPSNPRLMARVLDAVANLGDTRGSSAREVLSFIRNNNISFKNLTLQVHRALKHGVNAGLLRHRSGRYKALATLNPNVSAPPANNKEFATNGEKNEEKKSKFDIRAPSSDVESSRQTQQCKKRTTSRRRNSRHRDSKTKRKSSPYIRRSNVAQKRKRRQRKRTYEEFEDQPSEQNVLYGRDDSPLSFNRRTKRSRASKRKLESDFSDESNCDNNVSRKRISRANKSLCRETRHKEMCEKSRGRSASRARSLQLLQPAMQARQHPTEESRNDRQYCDEDHESSTEHNVARQEAHKDVERIREANDSNSGSTLENSRD
ncbi:uncharacterized protein LOC105838192 isoform X2 [Monomorium pharaonis]|uniref:uncharacterized protein LOC105838192 isoform X2 n=1 Tax=Monomorium pharaonis TaxID=307658 RepID=UPI0017474F33|nr:uncharacterized protein LOC105838192 isoform X2 [Monomorium pharaonis]